MIRVFTTTVCPKCRKLKDFLYGKCIEFDVIDMESAEGMTELVSRGIFIWDAPVLQVGESFYAPKQLFRGTELLEAFIIEQVDNVVTDVNINSVEYNMVVGREDGN